MKTKNSQEKHMAKRSAVFYPNGRCGDAKRRKMENKEQSSMEREAELKQKIKKSKVAAESYKLKSENIKEEIEELGQREENLHNQIRKADADADLYRSQAENFVAEFKVLLDFDDWIRIYAPAAAVFPHQEEILCGSDAGYPTDAYYGCPGDEGECDHAFLPCNDPSLSFGSTNSPIVSPSSHKPPYRPSISATMPELPTESRKERCTAKRSSDSDPTDDSSIGGGKRRKLQAKEHLTSLEIEADLKQELEEADKEVEFYKVMCDFGRYELDECRQRAKDLLQKLSKAKIRAEQYQREVKLMDEHVRHEWLMVILGRPVLAVAAADSNSEEILCCSDTGYPTEVCRCCGDEEACMVVLPCNCLSLCMMCETETDMCPNCGSIKTGWFWADMAK